MARFDLPDGVHRVRRKLVGGTVRFHFYAWRGGPKFWAGTEFRPTDPKFSLAYAAAVGLPKPSALMVPKLVDDFLSSPHMPKGERTKADYRL